MSLNSSTNTDDSLSYPQLYSINSSLDFELFCSFAQSSLVITILTVTNSFLLFPLCIVVLYLGLQRWRQQRSSTAALMTHSDCFTYHMALMEIIKVFGTILCCTGMYMFDFKMLLAWMFLFNFTWYGETFFHNLTCAEHYVAVVHPIVYLSLRKQRGIRIRNIINGCIWLFCFGGTFVNIVFKVPVTVDFCFLISFFIITSYCCLSVLYVLIRPGPGDQGRDRERVDQSKLKAFYTILAILGVMLLRCIWYLVWFVLLMLNDEISRCVWIICDSWINIPSSLVLPLLFIQRAGRLACCKNNMK
ncbi:uncharacterized protein [Channa argus]|uniref:uncharacterized protein n=1 Tax=Channa argus TaxID=215402 RepID=UPI0035218CA0